MLAIQNDIHSQRKAHFSVPEEVARKYRKKGIELSVLNEDIKGMIKLPLTPTDTEMDDIEDVCAGFTYFGQVVSHDLAYMLRQRQSYITALELHTIYGDMELVPPVFLRKKEYIDGAYELPLGENILLENAKFRYRQKDDLYYDFIRDGEGNAIILDDRNDDNFIVGQLALLFMRFHNTVCDHLAAKRVYYSSEQLFVAAKKVVVSCYRWIVVHQYLKMIVSDEALIDNLLNAHKNFKIFKSKRPPIIMPEFTDAVFRIGHSQVQNAYRLNSILLPFAIFGIDPKTSLNGQTDRIENPILMEWNFLFDMGNNAKLQHMAAMNPEFTNAFVMGSIRDLIKIDIYRNSLYGYEFAKNLKFDTLTEKNIDDCITYFSSRMSVNMELVELKKLPLGIYTLIEAHTFKEGQRLGNLGSQIIAEQIIWAVGELVEPNMAAITTAQGEKILTMQDLIRFVESPSM